MAVKLGVVVVSLLITALIGSVLGKLFAPGGSFLWWSNRGLLHALALVVAIPAIFVVTYIGVSQRLQNTTTRSALVESLIALLLVAVVAGLGVALAEWRDKAAFARQQKRRIALSQSSPYTITAIKRGILTATAADGTTIETEHPMLLYFLSHNDTDVPIIEEALQNEVDNQPFRVLLDGRTVSVPLPENGVYRVPPRGVTIVDRQNNPITAYELLDRVLEHVGTVRYYDELAYQDLSSPQDYERHYANVYLTSETGDTVIFNARIVRCEGEEAACKSVDRVLYSGINHHKINRRDYRSKLEELPLVNRPVVLTGVETPEGLVVHKIKIL